MSIRAVSWALDDAPAELSSVERFVLVALADHVDDETRKAWPSVARLATRTGLSRRSVQRALRTLESAGIVTSSTQQGPIRDGRGDMRPNLYLWHPERATGDPAGPVDNWPNGATDRRPAIRSGEQRGVTQSRTGRHPDALTVIEPSGKPAVVDVGESLSPVHSPQATVPTVEQAAAQWWQQIDEPTPSTHVRDRADEARRAMRGVTPKSGDDKEGPTQTDPEGDPPW